MNKARRDRLNTAISGIQELTAELPGWRSAIARQQGILDGEQEAYDNMPESLQNGERGEQASSAIDQMQIAIDSLGEAESAIEEAAQ